MILDEPNASLDEQGELALQQVIRQLSQQKKTVVIISHRPGILPLTSHLLVLEGGKQKLYGPTSQLLQHAARPANQPKTAPAGQGKAHA